MCPQCGGTVVLVEIQGLCPRCLRRMLQRLDAEEPCRACPVQMKATNLHRNPSAAFVPPATAAPFIFLVDDEPRLIELYIMLLGGTGYEVKAFNDRARALAALETDWKRPDLLIMDYLGHAMPVERFMQRCLAVHPTLRILVASGFNQTDARFASVKPDRFLQKPFTPAALLREIRAALVPVRRP